jgi:membrane protein
MLRALKVPIGWTEIGRRTFAEIVADNCLGLAAQLAYYFFLALFPALLFLVALISFLPLGDLLNTITQTLGRVAPPEVLAIIQDQIVKIAERDQGGLLTVGVAGAVWSTSSGMTAIIDTLNRAYDIQESRPWWKVRLNAIGLTIAIALFIVLSTALVLVGPALAERVAQWFSLGPAFAWTWKIVQWPVVFVLVSVAFAIIYYYAPDAQQEWVWITPGSLLATLLWLLVSLGFKLYVVAFGGYNATYGTIGGVIVLLLWFYLSGLAVLVGAELNAEIEHSSPYGKDPGERAPGEKKMIGSMAERAWRNRPTPTGLAQAPLAVNCDIDRQLPPAQRPAGARPRPSDWIVGALALAEAGLYVYIKLARALRSRSNRAAA